MIDFKSPYVIGGGVLLGVVLLLRSSSQPQVIQSPAIDYTGLANIAAQQNIALGTHSIDANSANTIAQLNYQGILAASNNALTTSIGHDILASVNNSGNNQANVISTIATNTTNTQLASIAANRDVTAIGMQTRANVANSQIISDAAVKTAQINADAAKAIQQMQSDAGMFGAGFNFLGGAVKSIVGN
jgi:hypothetical protein